MFPHFFIAFRKSTFTFEQFEKNDEPHTLCFSEIMNGEKRAYVNV